MKDAVVCASFGTAAKGRADLLAVETALKAAVPSCHFVHAFTSLSVCRRQAPNRKTTDSLPTVLERLIQEGYRKVTIQPTHLLYGYGYDTMKAEIAPYLQRFDRLVMGKPLLADGRDLQMLAAVLDRAYPAQPQETLVLMGHGTHQLAGLVYPALQSAFALQGRTDVLVGTMKSWPMLAQLLPALQQSKNRKVHLVPLLLVAGEHACQDMAGDQPESWKSQLEQAGFTVRCTLQGLGSLAGVQQMYCAKLQDILE